MSVVASSTFQGMCLVSMDGSETMEYYYDRLPFPIRKRISSSRYNLCPACVAETAYMKSGAGSLFAAPSQFYIEVIEEFEAQLDVIHNTQTEV